ncbi:MAG: NADPH:quinone reductase [Planctomycetales bacterium]|nr:NADPH:quinone reductase [Planctomycetales bacterium]
MKAAFITQTGPPDCIQYGDLPQPTPAPTEVLVKTTAVSVNPVDTYIRNGANYWELPNPFIIGCDLAGVIEAVGAEVKDWQVGQRVWGSNQGLLGRQGTFAEYCAVDPCWLYPTPDGVSDEDAAACSLVGITAHLGLFRDAQLQSGETVFVHGGTGGVGSMVLQMAKAAGARVITTAGSEQKAARARELGADEVILYKQHDVADEFARLCPAGAQVFWETLREPNFDFICGCLGERGRLVLMAGRDARPEFPVGPFYVKGCSLHGFVMFKATPAEQRVCAEDINRWLADGKLNAQIGRRMKLSEAAEAHRLQEANTLEKSGTLIGKIVLTP